MSGAGGCVAPPSRAGWPGAWARPCPRWSPRPVRPAWGAPGRTAAVAVVEGSPPQALSPGHPGGLRTGLGTGSERFLGPAPRGVRHTVAEGLAGFGRRRRPARGQRESPERGREAEGADASRRTALGAPGALSLVRDRGESSPKRLPEKFSARLGWREWRSTTFFPHQRSGRWPRSPSTDSEMAPAGGCRGREVGRCGRTGPAASRTPPGRRGLLESPGASGGRRGRLRAP